MKKFKLEVDQAELGLIVEHLNDGQYKRVAQLLSNLHTQVQKQLPKTPAQKAASGAKKAAAIVAHSNGNYAKGP